MAQGLEHALHDDRLDPIPALSARYPAPADRAGWVRQVFDETAADYDRVERVLSLGSGRWYRRQALRDAGLCAGMRVADIGTGTGLLAREALAIVGSSGLVVGVDPSEGMLEHARNSLGITTHVARAETLPLPDGAFDFVSMGYALRHVSDLNAAFGEFARVLRPGGRVCLLEITRPANPLLALALRAHMALTSRIACLLPGTCPRTPELWAYYRQTIERCVPAALVLEALGRSGFGEAHRDVSLGVFSAYTATRA